MPPLSPRSVYYLLGLAAFNLVLLWGVIPVGFLAAVLAIVVLRALWTWKNLPQPPAKLLWVYLPMIAAATGMAIMSRQYAAFPILIGGGLAALLYRKPTQRTGVLLLMACFALLLCALFYTGRDEFPPLLQADLFLTFTLFYQIHYPPQAGQFLPFIFKNVLRLALIIWVGLYVFSTFFPELSGRVLAWYAKHYIGFGRGVQLDPGKMARLSRSKKVVFRARFPQGIPKPENLYWRGATLSYTTDGLHWEKGPERPQVSMVTVASDAPVIRQEILLEPQANYRLFALDTPMALTIPPGDTPLLPTRGHDGTFTNISLLDRKALYQAVSLPEPEYPALSPAEREEYLQTPPVTDSRIGTLVKQLSPHRKQADVLAQNIMAMFKDGYRYSLSSPPLKQNALAMFLFDTRVGHCEHYAASFATLMRLMGVPARVVLGYEGGEVNPYDGTLIIRDKDAHAWVEIWWEQEKRWLRYDPTAVVAPEQLALGTWGNRTPDDPRLSLLESLRGWRLGLDAMATEWQYARLGGTPTLSREPRRYWQPWAVLLGFLLVSAGLFIALLNRNQIRLLFAPRDAVLQLYQQYCRELGRLGLKRLPSEGPLDFQRRCARQFPQIAGATDAFTRCYIALRYAPPDASPQTQPSTLKRHLATLRKTLKATGPSNRRM